MNYYEFLRRKEKITFAEALEVLVPLFLKVHNWNVGDDIYKIKTEKRNLLKGVFESIVGKKYVEGKVVRGCKYDENDSPCYYGDGEPIIETYLGESYLDSAQLYKYIAFYLKYFEYEVPDELILLKSKYKQTSNLANNANGVDEKNNLQIISDQKQTSEESTPDKTILNDSVTGKPEFRFERTAQSWDIQFGDEILRGVKDIVGMQYIKLLLQNPGQAIGVIELQAMLNPEHIRVVNRH